MGEGFIAHVAEGYYDLSVVKTKDEGNRGCSARTWAYRSIGHCDRAAKVVTT